MLIGEVAFSRFAKDYLWPFSKFVLFINVFIQMFLSTYQMIGNGNQSDKIPSSSGVYILVGEDR